MSIFHTFETLNSQGPGLSPRGVSSPIEAGIWGGSINFGLAGAVGEP